MGVVVLLTNFTWLEPSRVVNQVIQVGQLKGLGIDDSPVCPGAKRLGFPYNDNAHVRIRLVST